MITETAAHRAIDKAIGDALRLRGRQIDDYDRDVEFSIPMYVRRLCERLHSIICRDDVTLQDVIVADTCASGHVDYQRKLALYCAELAEYGKMQGRL